MVKRTSSDVPELGSHEPSRVIHLIIDVALGLFEILQHPGERCHSILLSRPVLFWLGIQLSIARAPVEDVEDHLNSNPEGNQAPAEWPEDLKQDEQRCNKTCQTDQTDCSSRSLSIAWCS